MTTNKIGTLKIIKDNRTDTRGLIRCIKRLQYIAEDGFEVDKHPGDIVTSVNFNISNEYWEPVQVIVICDDEIKAGDKVYNIYNEANKRGEIIEVKEDEVVSANYLNFPKVLVLSNQIPHGIIQLVVEGKLKDGDKVKVEISHIENNCFRQDTFDGCSCGECGKEVLKLNDNTTIIHPYKETVLCTECGYKGDNKEICPSPTECNIKVLETVEEAARKHANLKEGFDKAEEEYYNSTGMNAYYSFIAGAKWVAENNQKVYTEDEVRELCNNSFKAGGKFIATEGKVYSQSENFEEWWNKNKK